MSESSPSNQTNSSATFAANRTWLTLAIVTFLASSQSSFSIVGIPYFAEANDIRPGETAILIGCFPLMAAIAAFFAGPLSDLKGRSTLLVSGLSILSLSLVLHPLCTDFWNLLVARAFAGIGVGTLTGLPSIIVTDTVSKNSHHSHISRTLCGYAIGHTICIPAGIWLFESIGYLELNAYLGLLAATLVPIALVQIPKKELISLAHNSTEDRSYLSSAYKGLAARKLIALFLTGFTSFAATSIFYVTFTLWLYQIAKLRPNEISPMYLAAGILQLFVFYYAIQRKDSSNTARLPIISFALNAGLLFAFAFCCYNLTTATVLFALTIGTVSLRIPSIQQLVNQLGPQEQKGLRMSLLQISNFCGKAIGSSAATISFASLGHQALFAVAGLLMIPSLLYFYRLNHSLELQRLHNNTPEQKLAAS